MPKAYPIATLDFEQKQLPHSSQFAHSAEENKAFQKANHIRLLDWSNVSLIESDKKKTIVKARPSLPVSKHFQRTYGRNCVTMHFDSEKMKFACNTEDKLRDTQNIGYPPLTLQEWHIQIVGLDCYMKAKTETSISNPSANFPVYVAIKFLNDNGDLPCKMFTLESSIAKAFLRCIAKRKFIAQLKKTADVNDEDIEDENDYDVSSVTYEEYIEESHRRGLLLSFGFGACITNDGKKRYLYQIMPYADGSHVSADRNLEKMLSIASGVYRLRNDRLFVANNQEFMKHPLWREQTGIKKTNGRYSGRVALLAHRQARIMFTAISGLATLHQAGFVHLDNKIRNVFVALGKYGLIADFEGAYRLFVDPGTHPDGTELVITATPGLYPPEVRRQRGAVDFKWDIFQFGIMLLETLGGYPNVHHILACRKKPGEYYEHKFKELKAKVNGDMTKFSMTILELENKVLRRDKELASKTRALRQKDAQLEKMEKELSTLKAMNVKLLSETLKSKAISNPKPKKKPAHKSITVSDDVDKIQQDSKEIQAENLRELKRFMSARITMDEHDNNEDPQRDKKRREYKGEEETDKMIDDIVGADPDNDEEEDENQESVEVEEVDVVNRRDHLKKVVKVADDPKKKDPKESEAPNDHEDMDDDNDEQETRLSEAKLIELFGDRPTMNWILWCGGQKDFLEYMVPQPPPEGISTIGATYNIYRTGANKHFYTFLRYCYGDQGTILLCDMIDRCLRFDSRDRITADELLDHRFWYEVIDFAGHTIGQVADRPLRPNSVTIPPLPTPPPPIRSSTCPSMTPTVTLDHEVIAPATDRRTVQGIRKRGERRYRPVLISSIRLNNHRLEPIRCTPDQKVEKSEIDKKEVAKLHLLEHRKKYYDVSWNLIAEVPIEVKDFAYELFTHIIPMELQESCTQLMRAVCIRIALIQSMVLIPDEKLIANMLLSPKILKSLSKTQIDELISILGGILTNLMMDIYMNCGFGIHPLKQL